MRVPAFPSIVCMLLALAVPASAETSPSDVDVEKAVQRACALLVANQENYTPDPVVGGLPDDELVAWQKGERERLDAIRENAATAASEWPYEGVYRIGPDGRIPPGYRVGGSAIVCEALLEADGLDDERREAILRSVDFMLERIHDDPRMAAKKQTKYDVRGWGQAYALKFFLRALEVELFEDAALETRVRETIPHLIACLEESQVGGGGWNYAGRGSSPFMTASTLLALFHAEAAGYDVDAQMVEDALDALERARGKNMAYAYSGSLQNPDLPMQGACARSAIAELVLYRAGRSSVENLERAVDGFFTEENWRELRKRKSEQGTHARPYGIAPYYFFYGHAYAALAVEYLPEEKRDEYRRAMRGLLWRTIEANGGWNDRIFPRTESYSTAMSVLSLIAEDLPEVKAWTSEAKTPVEAEL